MEDKILVYKCKKGNSDAMRKIYDKYRDHLLILGISLCRDASLAEDAVHDVFVTFAQRIDSFTLTGSLKAYLATCTANRLRDLARSRKNNLLPLEQNDPADPNQTPAEKIICNEQLTELANALAQLPFEQRQVIALRIFSQIPIKAIAQSQSVSVNTVKGRYRYAITKLRSLLKDEVKK